jgi:hypothetical protein
MRKLFGALALAALLSATITAESLWTDEAFSAFMASHRSLASCWSTLVTGDSSDLQMALYYLYLHCWSSLFGQSEIAFRTANIPFILLFAGVLVWASERLFQSRWVWMVAAVAPLAVAFASDTRPYFDEIAISLACLSCLLAYLQFPSLGERKVLPWLVLLSLMMGAGFHMLMLLVVPPMAVVAMVFYMADRQSIRWQDWKKPLLILSPAGAGLAAYFAWTFGRGATYNYARPDVLSMASVFFRFAGLSGYSPNRHYDLPFHPYLAAMAISTMALTAALAALFVARRKSEGNVSFRALFWAMATAVVQISILSFGLRQQIEFRHLSSLLPLLLLGIMAGLSAKGATARRYVAFAAAALGITWLGSDVRLLFAPEYRREDFKDAVRQSIELHQSSNASIALAADPMAAAYYGLDVQGSQPCFPLTDSCAEGFAKVPWKKRVRAEYALFWSASRINAWLAEQKRNKVPVVLLISRSRHPITKDCAWWPIMEKQPDARVYPEYGFFVYLVP